MKTKVEVDTTEFMKQVERVVARGCSVMAVELNKRVAQVLIGAKGYKGAVHLTRKATASRIKRDLLKKYQAHQVAGTYKAHKRLGFAKAPQGGTKPVPLVIIKASKMLKKKGQSKGLGIAGWRAAVSGASALIMKARDQSRAYLAAGWLNCAKDLGVDIKSRLVKLRHESGIKRPASASNAFRATSGNLEVRCYNASADEGTAAGAIVQEGLNAGIAEQVKDMETHLQKRAEEAMAKAARDAEFAARSTIRYA